MGNGTHTRPSIVAPTQPQTVYISPMVGPQTANREKKNPPENEFRRVGMCCRAGRIESVIAFLWDHARRLPIEYGVYTKKGAHRNLGWREC